MSLCSIVLKTEKPVSAALRAVAGEWPGCAEGRASGGPTHGRSVLWSSSPQWALGSERGGASRPWDAPPGRSPSPCSGHQALRGGHCGDTSSAQTLPMHVSLSHQGTDQNLLAESLANRFFTRTRKKWGSDTVDARCTAIRLSVRGSLCVLAQLVCGKQAQTVHLCM